MASSAKPERGAARRRSVKRRKRMNREFLYELLETGSVSGNETELEKKIYDYMASHGMTA